MLMRAVLLTPPLAQAAELSSHSPIAGIDPSNGLHKRTQSSCGRLRRLFRQKQKN
jgi:hypothetical protein